MKNLNKASTKELFVLLVVLLLALGLLGYVFLYWNSKPQTIEPFTIKLRGLKGQQINLTEKDVLMILNGILPKGVGELKSSDITQYVRDIKEIIINNKTPGSLGTNAYFTKLFNDTDPTNPISGAKIATRADLLKAIADIASKSKVVIPTTAVTTTTTNADK